MIEWFIKIATIGAAAGQYVGPLVQLAQLALRAKDPTLDEDSVKLAIQKITNTTSGQKAAEDAVFSELDGKPSSEV